MPRFRLNVLDNYLDEAGRLHGKVIDARRELEDFYKVAADDLKLKPKVLKRLVRRVVLGEDDQDREIDNLISDIEQQRSGG